MSDASGPTLATLGVKVDATEGIASLGKLDAATDSTARKAAELERVTRMLAGAQAQQAIQAKATATIVNEGRQAYAMSGAQFEEWKNRMASANVESMRLAQTVKQATAAVKDFSPPTDAAARAMALAEMEAYKLDAAMGKVAQSSNHGGLQLGRLRMELGTLVGRLTGTNTAMDRMGGAIGSMAVGTPLMIGVLAGVAAISYAYEKFTEQSRLAQKQAEETRKEFEKIAHMGVAAQGEAAGIAYSGDPFGTNVLQTGTLKQLIALRDESNRKIKEGIESYENLGGQIRKTTIANEYEINQAKLYNKEIERRQTLLASVVGLQGSGTITRAGTAQAAADLPGFITDQIKAREAADKLAARDATRQQTEARTLEHIADQEERRLNAAIALNQAAEQGVKAYERELHTQQLQNQLLEIEQRIRTSFLDISGKQRAGTEEAMQLEIQRARISAEAQDATARQTAQRLDADRAADALRKKDQAGYLKDAIDGIKALEKIQEQQRVESQKYASEMHDIWRRGFEQIAISGIKSFKSFFSEVDRLFTRLMERMEKGGETDGLGYRLLSFGQRAITGGFAGYDIGHSTGSAAIGALGGAAAGYAAGGIPGAVAGFVGGLLGSGKAAREHAKALAEAQAVLATTLAGLRASLANDPLGAGIAAANAERAALIKQAEDAYSGGGANSDQVRKRGAVEADINALEDQKIAKLREGFALSQRYAQEDYAVRTLRAKGLGAEADAMAFAEAQERELTAARMAGADATTLATLATTQAAEADARAAQIAQERARAEEDARLRLMGATGDPAYAGAARAAQERRELEDLVAKGASALTIELTKLAQAAEDAAKAAADARAAEAAMADLRVRELVATGHQQQADDYAYAQQQKREYDDAVAAHKDQAYLDYLLQVQKEEAAKRQQDAINAALGPVGALSNAGLSAGAKQAINAVSATVTERSALELVEINRAQLTTLGEIRDAVRGGGFGGGAVFHTTIVLGANADAETIANALLDQIEQKIDERFGGRLNLQHIYSGSVAR